MRAPRRKQGMLIPLMVALISKLFCSQRLSDNVELRGWSTRHRHTRINYMLFGLPEMLILLHFTMVLDDFWETVPFPVTVHSAVGTKWE